MRVIIEKPFGTTLEEARELNRRVLVDLRRDAGLPHRPLPRQGDGPEPAGVPLRQRHVRAAVEPQLHRQRADHGRRGHRHRHPRRVLRRTPGALRDLIQNHMMQLLCHVAMEPPVNFTAEEVRNEKVKVLEAIPEPTAARTSPRWRCARSTAPATPAARTSAATSKRTACRRTRHRDLRRDAPGGRQLALGRRALLPAHRQAPGAQGHRDRGDAEAGPAPRLQPGRLARRAAQPARADASSPTRACRCGSARRSRARA